MMNPIFWKELKFSRKNLLIWCAVMFLTISWGAAEYPMVTKNVEMVIQGLDMIPRVVSIMFGVEGVLLNSPLDYHIVMYFWCALIAYAHAVFTGVTVIGKEERDKTGEFLFTKPFPRSTALTAKILVGLINIAAVNAVTWLGSIGTLYITSSSLSVQVDGYSMQAVIALSMLGMFLTQLVFLMIGILAAAFFRTYKSAVRFAMGYLLISYAAGVTIEYFRSVDYLNILSPFRYFPAQAVIQEGLSQFFLCTVLVISAVTLWGTFYFFNQKDILI